MVGHSRARQIALKDDAARGAPEASKQRRKAKTSAGSSPLDCRGPLELAKLSAERDKIALELGQLQGTALSPNELQAKKERSLSRDALELAELQGGALQPDELRAKKDDEAAKRTFELQKLRREATNARWSPWFEFGKVVLPALAIAGSIWAAANNIAYQQNKDRAAEISEQLAQFTDKIIDDADSQKQRNAISVVRSLREHAIPSLVTNLDLKRDNEPILAAIRIAILGLNEDPELNLRPAISQELLSSVKYVALRDLTAKQDIDLLTLSRYIQLWHECLHQYKDSDGKLFKLASSKGNQLANELITQIRLKVMNEKKREDYVNAVKQLSLKK